MPDNDKIKATGEAAHELFMQGFNCSQSVAGAFAGDMGLTREQALKLSAGFGGGFARMREVCGCFSGMVLVASALYGNTDPAGKSDFYKEIQELAASYKERNGGGSIVCRELLGLEKAEGTYKAAPRTEEYYQKRPCPELARLAAEITEEYIEQRQAQKG